MERIIKKSSIISLLGNERNGVERTIWKKSEHAQNYLYLDKDKVHHIEH